MNETRRPRASKTKAAFTFLLCLLLSGALWAQNQCADCNSQSGVRAVKFGKQTRYLCNDCRNKTQNCALCYKPGELELLQDGRRVCAACKKNKVLTQDQLETVYTGVKEYLKRDPAGLLVSSPPPVKLADKDEIQTKFTSSGRSMEVAGFYQAYNPEQIFILSGQTPQKCAGTIVHEYTHAWQTRNCPSQDRALVEGFASWVEYRYLMSQGRRNEAIGLTRKSDPDYGQSLLKFLELEKSLGVAGVVSFAKKETKLP